MDCRIVEKPTFEVVGKSKLFTRENYFKEAPNFWKRYINTKEYENLWNFTNGKWGKVSEAPLMSAYLQKENGTKETFYEIFGIENLVEIEPNKFKKYSIPAATYAEFFCTYQTSRKMNKFIYEKWLPSSDYARDTLKADIAAFYPMAFRSIKSMNVRWWIPIVKIK